MYTHTCSHKGDLYRMRERLVLHVTEFLHDHRNDPTEIYNEEFF